MLAPQSASDRYRAHRTITGAAGAGSSMCNTDLKFVGPTSGLPHPASALWGVLLLIFRQAGPPAWRPPSRFVSVSAWRFPPCAAWKHLVRAWILPPECPRDAGPTATPFSHPHSSSPGPTPLQPPQTTYLLLHIVPSLSYLLVTYGKCNFP